MDVFLRNMLHKLTQANSKLIESVHSATVSIHYYKPKYPLAMIMMAADGCDTNPWPDSGTSRRAEPCSTISLVS